MKKFLSLIAVLALSVMMCLAFTACGSDEEPVEDSAKASYGEADENFVPSIQQRGYIVVGCKTDVPELSFYDEAADQWSGLEVQLAYKVAGQLFNVSADEAEAQGLVKFVGVTVADREEMLEKGDIDLMLATYTITDERAERFALSESYYTDYIGIMVRNSGSDSNSLGTGDVTNVSALDGKYIGVPKKATTRDAFIRYIESMDTENVSPIFNEYDSYDQLYTALKKGEIDAMSVDVSILKGYEDSSMKILDVRFGGQNYGGATLPENRILLDYVNEAIENM